jgi:type I restriction enzyme, R subunit
VDKDLSQKTQKLRHDQTTLYNLEPPGAIHELGPAELAALKRSDASAGTKVLNLARVLAKVVDSESAAKPFLLSIGERAEAVRQSYEDRQVTNQQALEQFNRLAESYVEADAVRQRLGINANAYGIYTTPQPYNGELTAADAQAVDGLFGRFPRLHLEPAAGA